MTNLLELRGRFDKIVSRISRPGIENLVAWLETTDFFTAPASTKFHGNFEGGLLLHSIYVTEFALVNLNYAAKYKPALSEDLESVLITALFHDVCKVNQYKMEKCWTKNDDNKWVSYMGWKFEDNFPLGHGEKSVYYISKHMQLTNAEALAVRYHMGTSEPGTQIPGLPQYSYQSAFELSLTKIIIAADIMATAIETTVDLKATAQ